MEHFYGPRYLLSWQSSNFICGVMHVGVSQLTLGLECHWPHRQNECLLSHKFNGKCMEISQKKVPWRISTHWLIVVRGILWLWIWSIMPVVCCAQIRFPQYFISSCKMWFLHQYHEFVLHLKSCVLGLCEICVSFLSAVYSYPCGHAPIQTSYFQIAC